MAEPLKGRTVAIVEHRYSREMQTLFERLGARVHACPMILEQPVEDKTEVRRFINSVIAGAMHFVIFMTGVGARTLAAEAESIGLRQQLLDALQQTTVVVRGPKPVKALRELRVRIDVVPEVPTSEGVIEALRHHDVRGKRVGIQLYGVTNPQLVEGIQAMGAEVFPVEVYRYGEASNSNEVRAFIDTLRSGNIDVIAFTSAPQVRALFRASDKLGLRSALSEKLRDRTLIASIGEVTNAALLAEAGLHPAIVPEDPKMGALVRAVSEYYESQLQ